MRFIKLALLIFLCVIDLIAFGQSKNNVNHFLIGRVYSKTEAIMYATIGIEKENIGTISDDKGEFVFKIPKIHLDKRLFVSHIGYKSLDLNIDSLIILGEISIELKEKIEYLNEVTVSSKALKGKTKEYGNTKKHNLFLWIKNDEKGSEIATLITPKNEIYLNSVSVNVLNNSNKAFTLLLNLYSIEESSKTPKKQLLHNQQIITSDIAKGWLEIDLSKENLILNDPFFVSFQWTDVDEPVPLIGGNAKSSKRSLIRYNALGTWEKFAEWDIKVKGTSYTTQN